MIAKKVEQLRPSGIRAFFDLVLGMKDVISLGVGEPDFDTPWSIREKAISCLEEGYTSYTSNKGLVSLRRTLSLFLEKKYGVRYDPDNEMLITVGVSEGLDLTCRALLERGEKIIVVAPYFVAYPALVELADGVPIILETQQSEGFKIQPKRLQDLMNKHRPKALLVNYPNNPTGVSYTKKELQEIWRIAKRFGCLVISDEVYDGLVYEYDHTCFASLSGARKQTLLFGGFSKNFAMTGFRLGWVCGQAPIIAALTKIHQYSMMCAPILSQFAGVEALRSGGPEVEKMRREYKRRREYIVPALNELGLTTHMPEGAFYCFPSVKKTGMDGMSFATSLLKKNRVAVVPGNAFGDSYGEFIRISYAQPVEVLKEAVARISAFIA